MSRIKDYYMDEIEQNAREREERGYNDEPDIEQQIAAEMIKASKSVDKTCDNILTLLDEKKFCVEDDA